MRRFQFWILVVGSTLVSLMMLKQISLSRALNQQQAVLIESEEMADSAKTYEAAWQKLAMAIFQSSHQDPELAALLKNANVEIRTKPDLTDTSPAASTNVAPSAPGKTGTP